MIRRSFNDIHAGADRMIVNRRDLRARADDADQRRRAPFLIALAGDEPGRRDVECARIGPRAGDWKAAAAVLMGEISRRGPAEGACRFAGVFIARFASRLAEAIGLRTLEL